MGGGPAADVPRGGSDQSMAPSSAEQHLLQLLMRKQQPAVAVTTPQQQQQALLQMLLQSQATTQAARQPVVATTAFSLANLPSTAAVVAAAASQVSRPRAIKSQHSQPPLPDALQQALQQTEAAKLAEASKLADLRYACQLTQFEWYLSLISVSLLVLSCLSIIYPASNGEQAITRICWIV